MCFPLEGVSILPSYPTWGMKVCSFYRVNWIWTCRHLLSEGCHERRKCHVYQRVKQMGLSNLGDLWFSGNTIGKIQRYSPGMIKSRGTVFLQSIITIYSISVVSRFAFFFFFFTSPLVEISHLQKHMQINKIYSLTLKIYLFKPLISSTPPSPAPLLPLCFSLKNFILWHYFGTSIASKLGCTILKNKKVFYPDLFSLSTAFATKD